MEVGSYLSEHGQDNRNVQLIEVSLINNTDKRQFIVFPRSSEETSLFCSYFFWCLGNHMYYKVESIADDLENAFFAALLGKLTP